MAGKYQRAKPARKITLSEDRYLTCGQGRWLLHRRVKVVNSPTEEYAWVPLPITPSHARRLLDAAGIKEGEA